MTGFDDATALLVGPAEAAPVANALCWRHATDVEADDAAALTDAIVWGSIDRVARMRRLAPQARVVWRVGGLIVPLTAADRRLIGTIDHVVVPERHTASHLREALGRHEGLRTPRISVIETELGFVVPEPSTPARPLPRPVVGAMARGADAPNLILTLHRLLCGGVVRCDSCGRRSPSPFDPSTRSYGAAGRCGCGSTLVTLPGPDLDIRLAVDDVGSVVPETVVRWLGLEDRLEVVRLGAAPWQELAAWFLPCRLLVCASSAIDLPTASRVAVTLGIETIVPVDSGDRSEPHVHGIGYRSETDAGGRVSRVFDPLALDRAVRESLARSPNPVAPKRVVAGDTVGRWRQVLATTARMSEVPGPAERLRVAASGGP